MKIKEIPDRQIVTYDYMMSLEPVVRALDALKQAIVMLAEGAKPSSLPALVRQVKAFDGWHHEYNMLIELVKAVDELQLKVGRGFLKMERGKPEEVIKSQLERSDLFHVAFVPVDKIVPEAAGYSRGIEFSIHRDGQIHLLGSAGPLTNM